MIVVAVVAVVAVVGLALIVFYWRRHSDPPLTLDWCRICHRDLHVGDVWEVRASHESADDGQGGMYMAATYCRRHRPAGAIRVKT